MNLRKSNNFNENYAARFVRLQNVRKHINADRLQCVSVIGNNVITDLSAKDGDVYIFFPAETKLNADFIAFTNGFRDKELNRDKSAKAGFFEDNCRIKNIKLREEKSEGYIVSLSDFSDFLLHKKLNAEFDDSLLNTDFDMIESLVICQKYFVEPPAQVRLSKSEKRANKLARFDRLDTSQFRFHIDTSHLGKNLFKIQPYSVISVTNKIHGSSVIVSKVMVNRKLTFLERFAKKFLGICVLEKEYDVIYASRTVVKNRYINQNAGSYYGVDIWSMVGEQLKDHVQSGITLYGEVAGYLPTGAYIQKNYDYGNLKGEYSVFIYRITHTSADGKVFEFSWPQIKQYCAKYGLTHVPEFFYGQAKDLFPELELGENWKSDFYAKLTEKYLEKDCNMCFNAVPSEGVVLRIERSFDDFEAYKHKSFRFKNLESKNADNGESNLEDEQHLQEEN